MASLASLPPELIACILDFVPSIDLQQTVISLIHVLSYAFVPNWHHYLFYHVHSKTAESVIKLFEHFQRVPADATLVQKYSLTTWAVDANVAVDVILMLPNLKWLSLCMGEDFLLEHANRLLREPMMNLRYVSFRNRPRVLLHAATGTYTSLCSFLDLKDARFERAFSILTHWPSSDLPAVSVILDLPVLSLISASDSPEQVVEFEFLDLFSIFNLHLFASSRLLERTHAFRMRFPSFQIASFLHMNRPPLPSPPLPSVTLLDLSTCSLSVEDVHFLLVNLRCLLHLILDGCGILGDAPVEGWVEFGHECLMINSGSEDETSVASTTSIGSPSGVSILPWSSKLRTLALSVPPNTDADAQRALIAAFQRGWSEAVTEFKDRLRAVWRSRSRGVQTLRFALPGEVGTISDSGYYGVVVADDDEFAHLDMAIDCPVVCLVGQAGREGGIEHAEGCAHSIGWDIWEDTL
ncbi:hypothetical protein BJV74DRAFT_985566 [Russula compacta]|nr:hypothetical protein BJV74DRAFT_985566 [Russula compacta]